MSETPQVTQSKLNVAHNEVRDVHPDELTPHPKNQEIYGDTEDVDGLNDEFVESIKQKGVLEPLTVTSDGKIISGHRRWIAAQEVNLSTVPVRKESFDSELEIREALIEFNRQREKTPGQIVNEFEEMLAVEEERAKERKGERNDLKEEPVGNVSHKSEDKERARSKAAEKVNADVSGRTLEKGKTVKDKAESDDEPEEVREAAREAWDGLQSGEESFNSAYEEVKQTEREVEEQQQKEQRETERKQSFESDENVVETFHGDFRDILKEYDGDVDHFVTDPPYDEDAIELWDALGNVAAEQLPDGGFLVAYSGKAHLPDIHDVLSDHLNYYWQGIVRHNGPGAKIFSRKLRTGYKPVLIYQKGDLAAQEDFVSDVIEGTGREKDDHEWQQAEGEAAELLERFTAVNDVVCDPMCGSGTIGVACLRLQRRAVLIEKDEDTIHTAREKVNSHE